MPSQSTRASQARLFARFLVVGFGNTVLGLAVIFGARQVVDEVQANLLGYLVVVPISFLSHRNLSFRDAGQHWPAFARFIGVTGLGYLANLATLTAALSAGLNPYFAQAAAIASHVVVTFLDPRHGTS